MEEKEEKKQVKKEVKKSNKELELLKNDFATLNDKFIRVNAEMQNMKRRYEEEISRIYRYEGEEFIKKTINVIDNFERAINMKTEILDDNFTKYLEGFKLIYNELLKNLNDIGVTEIECENKTFDPESMEAVLTEHVEGINPGIVTCIMQKGYKYNDKVIRHAMVKVNE